MIKIDKNPPPTKNDIVEFLSVITFKLPNGFIDFFSQTNGADITIDDNYIILWPLTEMVELNKEYRVVEYAPDFFIFGSDGGDISYAIEKRTGFIFEMPFIGMSKEEAVFKGSSFDEFISDN